MMGTIEDLDARECGSPEEESLRDLAKEYAEARDLVSEATRRKEQLREQILALVGDAKKIVAGAFFIAVTDQTRTTLDHDALRAGAAQAGFDLSPYNKVSTSKVLRIT